MKILHINTYASSGGAAIAARRHCEAMRRAGIESNVLSLFGNSDSLTVISEKQSEALSYKRKWGWLKHKIQRLQVKRFAWHWLDGDYDISSHSLVKNADVIYVHWVNDFLGINAIKALLNTGKPIVWFMHDMWPLTGGCHYSFDCNGYRMNCMHCPQMKIYRNKPHDIMYKKKCEWGQFANMYPVAPSIWLTECIKSSMLFGKNISYTIPNVIDTDLFKPIDKTIVRTKFSLPNDKKLIIFSSVGTHNPYKGAKYLIDAIEKLEDCDYEFIVVGKCDINIFSPNVRKKIHLMGYVTSQELMVQIYNSADVLIITSMAENFPNVVIEAMACGVPVVGFATGGIKDQIQHKENGWLVPQKNVQGLVCGINWVLNDADYSLLSKNARKYVEENCSYKNVLKIHKPILDLVKNV